MTLDLYHDQQPLRSGQHEDITAVVGTAGAWVLAGGKAAGKTTLLGALTLRGFSVLADDVVVIDDFSTGQIENLASAKGPRLGVIEGKVSECAGLADLVRSRLA